MSNTSKRVIVGLIMALIAAGAGTLEYFGYPAVRYLGTTIGVLMILEMIRCIIKTPKATLYKNRNLFVFGGFLLWLVVVMLAANSVGKNPWLILWLLMVISGADIGAWFFGRLLGGDKMWERLSAGKTWSGQIAGIICGTFASLMYGFLGADAFLPQLMWLGISVSLLSQYGDLTASWIKRRMGIKDFGNILPGHGGVIDRFDGWIYALPLVWLVLL